MSDSSIARLTDLVDEQTLLREGAPGTHPAWDTLVRIVWRLRQEDGCPWDKEQTHESLAKDLIGETYEAVEAIHEGDVAHLREELGDAIMVILLEAQVAADNDEFTIDDVCREIAEKLVRRHPHVFGDVAGEGAPGTAEGVLDLWDQIKKAERAEDEHRPDGLLDSVPTALPALMQCQKISKRAAKAGFEWESVADVWDQVASERAEFEAEERGSEAAAEEFGDLLFSLVNVARHEGIDAEEALAASNRKFRRRWAAMEAMAAEAGVELDSLSTERLNALWCEVKSQE